MTQPVDQVRTLLRITAEQMPDEPVTPRMPDLVVRRRDARRRRRLTLVAMFAAVLVAFGVPALYLGRPGPVPPTSLPGYNVPATAPTVSTDVDALAHGQWRQLPASPIPGRSSAATAWTGRQMVVWGGVSASGEQAYADGAAYDPTTRRWQALPAGPLSARSGTASVWTGRQLFIWGGAARTSGLRRTYADGALYDPGTGTWRTVAAAPLSAREGAVALWTGSQVVVLGGHDDGDGPLRVDLKAAAYDPTTDTWQRLPDLPVPQPRTVDRLTAAATLDGIHAWAYWEHDVATSYGGFGHSGVTQLRYDPSLGRWDVTDTGQPTDLGTPLWTGRELIFPASQPFHGYAPGPFKRNLSGWRLDPATGAWRRIPHGPVDDLGAESVWAGGVLLSFASGAQTSGPGGTTYPGQVALWNPATTRWTPLPPAPLYVLGPGAVWTGTELIEWGLVVDSESVGAHYVEGGLSFGP